MFINVLKNVQKFFYIETKVVFCVFINVLKNVQKFFYIGTKVVVFCMCVLFLCNDINFCMPVNFTIIALSYVCCHTLQLFMVIIKCYVMFVWLCRYIHIALPLLNFWARTKLFIVFIALHYKDQCCKNDNAAL